VSYPKTQQADLPAILPCQHKALYINLLVATTTSIGKLFDPVKEKQLIGWAYASPQI